MTKSKNIEEKNNEEISQSEKSEMKIEEKSEDGKQELTIDELKKQLAEEKNKHLMALADLENYKKRVVKEREDMNLIANAGVFNMFLEVMDDLNRAIDQMKQSGAEIVDGLTMIQDKVKRMLDEFGIEEIEVKPDDNFDPKNMEAIGTLTVAEDEKNNKVIHVERKGYKLKDKDFVIRGCRVIVGKVTK